MLSMSEKDLLNCFAILEALERIEQYTRPHQSAEQWMNDPISYDACLMNFVVIGEMTAKMSNDFLEQNKTLNGLKSKRSEILLRTIIWELIFKRCGKSFKPNFLN